MKKAAILVCCVAVVLALAEICAAAPTPGGGQSKNSRNSDDIDENRRSMDSNAFPGAAFDNAVYQQQYTPSSSSRSAAEAAEANLRRQNSPSTFVVEHLKVEFNDLTEDDIEILLALQDPFARPPADQVRLAKVTHLNSPNQGKIFYYLDEALKRPLSDFETIEFYRAIHPDLVRMRKEIAPEAPRESHTTKATRSMPGDSSSNYGESHIVRPKRRMPGVDDATAAYEAEKAASGSHRTSGAGKRAMPGDDGSGTSRLQKRDTPDSEAMVVEPATAYQDSVFPGNQPHSTSTRNAAANEDDEDASAKMADLLDDKETKKRGFPVIKASLISAAALYAAHKFLEDNGASFNLAHPDAQRSMVDELVLQISKARDAWAEYLAKGGEKLNSARRNMFEAPKPQQQQQQLLAVEANTKPVSVAA